jgi:aminopeptidase N
VEALAWRGLSRARHPGEALLWFDFYVGISHTPEAANTLSGILAGKKKPRFIQVGQSRRWDILKRLSQLGYRGIQRRIRTEQKNDKSDSGRKNALAALAAFPEVMIKEKMWTRFVDKQQVSLDLIRSEMREFHNYNRPEVSRGFMDRFFTVVPDMFSNRKRAFAKSFFRHLFPKECSGNVLARSKKALEKVNAYSDARRMFLEANENLERCIEIRKFNRAK